MSVRRLALDVTAAGYRVDGLTLDDNVLGGSVKLTTSSPVALIAKPCYSVSQSEGGFEKIMQAVTLTLEWPLRSGDMVVSLEVSTSQDITVPI